MTARELADTAGLPVSSVAPKLQGLVKSGLVRRHWGPDHSPGRTYSITDEGEDHLMRLERKLPSRDAAATRADRLQ